jgi:hypothetical protein
LYNMAIVGAILEVTSEVTTALSIESDNEDRAEDLVGIFL